VRHSPVHRPRALDGKNSIFLEDTMTRKTVLLPVLLLLTLSLLFPVSAFAGTTIPVNTDQDELNDDGDCSLREAVRAANLDTAVDACPAGSGTDLILIPAGTYLLSIPGTDEDAAQTGDLDLVQDVTIRGAGNTATILDADRLDRMFDILSPARVTLSQMTVQKGVDNGWCGGGIRNNGVLTLTHALVIANSSSVSGGGFCNEDGADATLETVAFGNNAAWHGAAINNSGTLTLTRVAMTFDTASGNAGGLYNWGPATLTDVTIAGETAAGDGGGIYNGGTLTLTNSTLSGNQATGGNGGALYNQYRMALTNVTFSGNSAGAGNGGGIYQWSYYASSLLNLTLSGNGASSGGGLYRDPGRAGAMNVKNTIVAYSPSGGNCAGTLTSLGHNLDSGNTCGFTQAGDLVNTDPLLGPLTHNGGRNQTHALLPGSPAIDAGTNAGCPATDQRGVARPFGPACDIGAFEYVVRVYLPLLLRGP
jgi:CSLREA domain-containing protein